jgi:hypothetical protein
MGSRFMRNLRGMDERPRPKPTTTPEEEGIEFHPDSWERFERTVQKVINAPPVHRTAKAKERPASKGRVHKGKTGR